MADHITIRTAPGTWVVRAGGAVLGESSQALELTEGDYPAVVYIPRGDMGMAFFERSPHTSVCPHKGTATYFHAVTSEDTLENVAWSYETPNAGMERIAGHLAFDTNRVAVEQV